MHTQLWWGGMRIGDRLEVLEVKRKITLKWYFDKCDKVGVGWIDLAEDRPVAGTCDVVTTFGLHKMREFLGKTMIYYFLKNLAPRSWSGSKLVSYSFGWLLVS